MKRTLFVTSNRLGDAVLTTGVLKHLIKMEPDVPITVVCGHLPREIFEAVNGVDSVIPISKRKYSLHWLEVLGKLGFNYWHRIIDFRGSPLGFLPTRHRHIWKGGSEHLHKVEANARVIGVDHPLPPSIVPQTENSKLRDRLPASERFLGIAPTANSPKKQWHHENFLKLASELTAENGIMAGAKIVVFGAPGEEAQAMPVVQNLPPEQVINFVGQTTPLQAAELLSYCSLFVGNDSGLMHTAVAVGIPTVGLFGIGKPVVYRPWGDKSLCLIGDPAGEQITRHYEMNNGEKTKYRETLPVDHVLRQIEAFYQNL